MRTRILMLSTVHPVMHSRYAGKLANALDAAGFEVECWARGTEHPSFLSKNVKLHLMPFRGKWKRMLDLPKALWRALTGRHDLVIIVPLEMVPVGLIAHLFGKKVLWDVEEYGAKVIRGSDWIPSKLRGLIAFIYNMVERLASVTFPAITIAEDSYAGRFHATRRLVRIHNYPLKPDGPDMSRGEIAEKRWAKPGPGLIYVGSVTHNRGIDDIIKVVAKLEDRLPNIRLDVVGGIPIKAYHQRIENLRRELKNPDRVIFHGHVPMDQLDGYFADTQIAVLPIWPVPNHLHSEPTKVYEYCIAGLPIVTGDVPVWRRLMDEARSGIAVQPRDIEAWADGIERLWAMGPEELAEMGRRARDLVYDRQYFWEADAKKLVELCHELMGQ